MTATELTVSCVSLTELPAETDLRCQDTLSPRKRGVAEFPLPCENRISSRTHKLKASGYKRRCVPATALACKLSLALQQMTRSTPCPLCCPIGLSDRRATTAMSSATTNEASTVSASLDVRALLATLPPGAVIAAVHFDSAYTNDIITATIASRPYISLIKPTPDTTLTNPPHIQWCEFELIHWPPILAPPTASTTPTQPAFHFASSYCTRKGLIRKAQFAHLLRKYITKRPQSTLASHCPDTHIADIQHADEVDELLCDLYEVRDMEERGEWWICKPSMYDGGEAVTVVRTVDQFTALIERHEGEVREWVVQQYIRPPLLAAGNRKFHIRAYVLCVGNLSVYVYNDMLALFALDPYTEDDTDSDELPDASRHLTNTCLAKSNPRFVEAEMVHPLTAILPPTQPLLHSVHTQIGAILHDTFDCLHSEPAYFQPLPTGYELFGFDFLVRADGRVFILEANAGPDFGQSGIGAGHAIVSGLMEATCSLVVDCGVAEAADRVAGDGSGSGKGSVNLARSSGRGVDSGYVALDGGEGEWEERRGRFRQCYSRLITQTTTMRYY